MRVTDMRGVDLSRYRFDYGLTSAFLLMNADGTVYHRYGSRDWTHSEARISMDALVDVMEKTLAEHEEYQQDPAPPQIGEPVYVEQLYRQARPDGPEVSCFHCHKVNDYRRRILVNEDKWIPEDELWKYPLPDRLGLRTDRDDPMLITEVEKRSPAAKAGLRPGDRIRRINGKSVLTTADIQWILDDVEKGPVTVALDRSGEAEEATLRLSEGWKVATPLDVSWRPLRMWVGVHNSINLQNLTETEREELGIPEESMAMRVRLIRKNGPWRKSGRAATRAGLRRGDVILSFDRRDDFENFRHFDMWFRMTKKPGSTLKIEVLREGKREMLEMKVPEQ